MQDKFKKCNRLLNILIVILLIFFLMIGCVFYFTELNYSISDISSEIVVPNKSRVFKENISFNDIDVNTYIDDSIIKNNEKYYKNYYMVLPVFEKVPKIKVEAEGSYYSRFYLLYNSITYYYNNEKHNITNDFRTSKGEMIDIDNCSAIFQYKNDYYFVSMVTNLKPLYYNPELSKIDNIGVAKYIIVNLTSKKQSKPIIVKRNLGNNNISKQDKYDKILDKNKIDHLACYEVGGKIQIVFDGIDQIKNSKLKNKLLKKYSNKNLKESRIYLSINKNDFNSFIKLLES